METPSNFSEEEKKKRKSERLHKKSGSTSKLSQTDFDATIDIPPDEFNKASNPSTPIPAEEITRKSSGSASKLSQTDFDATIDVPPDEFNKASNPSTPIPSSEEITRKSSGSTTKLSPAKNVDLTLDIPESEFNKPSLQKPSMPSVPSAKGATTRLSRPEMEHTLNIPEEEFNREKKSNTPSTPIPSQKFHKSSGATSRLSKSSEILEQTIELPVEEMVKKAEPNDPDATGFLPAEEIEKNLNGSNSYNNERTEDSDATGYLPVEQVEKELGQIQQTKAATTEEDPDATGYLPAEEIEQNLKGGHSPNQTKETAEDPDATGFLPAEQIEQNLIKGKQLHNRINSEEDPDSTGYLPVEQIEEKLGQIQQTKAATTEEDPDATGYLPAEEIEKNLNAKDDLAATKFIPQEEMSQRGHSVSNDLGATANVSPDAIEKNIASGQKRWTQDQTKKHPQKAAGSYTNEHTRPQPLPKRLSGSPQEGSFIADYKIIKKLGEGGMGTVYLCSDPMLKRKVAIKLLRSKFSQKKSFRARFEIEAQAVAQLRHPNIIQVFRAGEDLTRKCLFFAMDFIEGQGLDELIKSKEQLSVKETLNYIEQSAEGLKFSHDKNILHRDIKPANIMISNAGQAMLADFGLAKFVDNDEESREKILLDDESEFEDGNLTMKGSVVGTPLYLSPERILGINDDKRSDIYALGMVLYHCLTGNKPFYKSSLAEILNAQQHEEPEPIEKFRPDCPIEVLNIFKKATAKLTNKRFQTIDEMLQAIQDYRYKKDKEKEISEKKQLTAMAFTSIKEETKTSGISQVFKYVGGGLVVLLFLGLAGFLFQSFFGLNVRKNTLRDPNLPLETRQIDQNWKDGQITRLCGKFISSEESDQQVTVSIDTNVFSEGDSDSDPREIVFSEREWSSIKQELGQAPSEGDYLAFSGKAVVENEEDYLKGNLKSFLPIASIKWSHRKSERRTPTPLEDLSPELEGETLQIIGAITSIIEGPQERLELFLADNLGKSIWILMSKKVLDSLESKNYSPRIGDTIHVIGNLIVEGDGEVDEVSYSLEIDEKRIDSFSLSH